MRWNDIIGKAIGYRLNISEQLYRHAIKESDHFNPLEIRIIASDRRQEYLLQVIAFLVDSYESHRRLPPSLELCSVEPVIFEELRQFQMHIPIRILSGVSSRRLPLNDTIAKEASDYWKCLNRTTKARYVMLLEDDALVVPEFASMMTSLMRQLDRRPFIDYVKLYHPNQLRKIPSIPMVYLAEVSRVRRQCNCYGLQQPYACSCAPAQNSQICSCNTLWPCACSTTSSACTLPCQRSCVNACRSTSMPFLCQMTCSRTCSVACRNHPTSSSWTALSTSRLPPVVITPQGGPGCTNDCNNKCSSACLSQRFSTAQCSSSCQTSCGKVCNQLSTTVKPTQAQIKIEVTSGCLPTCSQACQSSCNPTISSSECRNTCDTVCAELCPAGPAVTVTAQNPTTISTTTAPAATTAATTTTLPPPTLLTTEVPLKINIQLAPDNEPSVARTQPISPECLQQCSMGCLQSCTQRTPAPLEGCGAFCNATCVQVCTPSEPSQMTAKDVSTYPVRLDPQQRCSSECQSVCQLACKSQASPSPCMDTCAPQCDRACSSPQIQRNSAELFHNNSIILPALVTKPLELTPPVVTPMIEPLSLTPPPAKVELSPSPLVETTTLPLKVNIVLEPDTTTSTTLRFKYSTPSCPVECARSCKKQCVNNPNEHCEELCRNECIRAICP
ncbi:hypothetical protein V3C99_010716 [Haemonchus contortus]